MGKRGPKPTPTPLLKLRGSWRGEVRDGEPQVEASLPDCPTWVSESASAHWKPIGETLRGLGIMAPVYSIALALLVDSLADFISLDLLCRGQSPVLSTESGDYPNPAFAMKAKAWERVLKALREFGMTPSAISAVKKVEESAPKGLGAFKLGG